MKKRLLSFFAFALLAFVAQAQSWTKPSLTVVTDKVPEKAYFYNVEQGKFLTKGTTWGTHAALTDDVAAAFLYEMQSVGDNESYKLYCSSAANTGCLGRSTDTELYTDYKAQVWDTTFVFKQVETGFKVLTAPGSTKGHGLAHSADVDYYLYEMGWNPDNDDVDNSGNSLGTNVGIFMLDPTLEGIQTVWAFMTEADYAVYNAQMSLYNKLNDAVEVGYTEAELSEYAALLTSTDAEAIAAAVSAVENKILNYAYDHATPENPYDVTAKIANPTFEGSRGAEPAGWTDEFSNMKIQNNKAYPIWDEENDVASTEYGFNNFSQNWTSSATESCGASNIYQTISELPQGTYILQADAIATSASASLEVSGAEIYATSGAARYAVAIDRNAYGVSGSSNPHRYQLYITHMGGDLTIGCALSADGYAKWFGCDNFKLFYAGPVDNPGLVALTSAVEAAQPYVDYYAQEDKYYYSESTKDDLEGELKKAESLTDSDACLAEAGTINDLMKTVKAEVSAYGKLKKFYTQVEEDVTKYPFIDDLSSKAEDYKAAYDDKTATIEQINTWIDGYSEFIKNGIKAAMADASEENPIEVTGLFENLGFEENTTESASPKNWECNSTAFKARANTGEVWNVSFDAHTTLTELPAGAYRITSHGLSRSGSSVDSYATLGANITAEFYANNSSVKVASQHLGAGAEQLHSSDVNLTEDEENPLWSPNSMEGARVYFNVAETPYVNTVTANLVKDGDPLVIGYRDLGDAEGTVAANSWTIWSDVRVYYIGVSTNALYNEMVELAQTAQGYSDVTMVTEAQTKLDNAVKAAEKLSSASSEADIVAAINDLNAAVEYYNEGKTLIQQVMNVESLYSDVLEKYDVADTELVKLIDEVSEAVAEENFESNEKMQGWLDALPAARTAHIFAAVVEGKSATEEEPIDVTAVLTNASFETNDATGWTVSNTGGSVGGQAAQRTGSTAYETWNSTAFDIHQTVPGLPEGYYALSVKALYRNGNNSDDLAAAYQAAPDSISALAKFYANDINVNVKSIYECAQVEDPAIDGQASFVLDGTTYYAPNTMISFENYAMDLDLYNNKIVMGLDGKTDLTLGLKYETTAGYAWFPFDDFKILYLGTEVPTGVEAVAAQPTLKSAGIFDLAGRKVSKAVKGIYIINGKKVVK